MAKTFDNISEASATNYLFLFAQRTLALQNEPPTPPPLNALGLPCKAICLLWGLLCPKHKAPAPDKMASGRATTAAAVTLEAAAETVEASPSPPPPLPSSEEVTRGEVTPPIQETVAGFAEKIVPLAEKSTPTFVEKVKPLADKITEYIQDHQDDAAQEERWRTTMKRDMGKSFRKVKAEMQSMHQRFDHVQQSMNQRLDEVHSKMDEKLDQIVKDLGRLTAV